MKKYENCPDGYEVLEQHPLYIKLFKVAPPTKGTGGGYTLIIPAQYWPRFIIDEQWRASLFAIYGKRVFTKKYPKKDYIFNGRIINAKPEESESRPGIVPDDLPFAFTKFPNCPEEYGKIYENDQYIKLDFYYIDGSDGGNLIVPAILWDKFVTDREWRNKMVVKYARLNELEWKTKEEIIERYSEFEWNKTGIIPESEL